MSTSTRGFSITTSVTLVTEECCSCGITFGMPADFRQQCLDNPGSNGKQFYCPNGHKQWYVGKSDAQKLREAKRQLEWARSRERALGDQLQASERSKAALKGVVTRTKRRIANGVCPCCQRSFKDLARHMAGQHPDYAAEESAA